MRRAYFDGAPGVFVSGAVWLASALVGHSVGLHQGVWTLLIGGALIHPMAGILTNMLGRSAKTSKDNALNQLTMASTIWLILCCAMAYGLFLSRPELFFPVMMATIGSRYLIFATIFGKSIFWVMGVSLIAIANVIFFAGVAPTMGAALGGLIEVVFAFVIFSNASSLADAE